MMVRSRSIKKRAQVVSIDFAISLLIFLIVLFLFFKYYAMTTDNSFIARELEIDANSISSSLMTRGYPLDWDASNVIIIGLTDGNYRIDQSKLQEFTSMDYQEARRLFKTSYDFYFFLETASGAVSDQYGLAPADEDHLIRMTRYVINNSTPIKMVIYAWD